MHTTKKLILCGLFVALLAVGAHLSIPLAGVPVTMQTLFVCLAGLLLGKTYAPLTLLGYLLLGLLGLPVFSRGGGIGYLLEPTFGYLLGFVAGSFVIGYLAQKHHPVLGVVLGLCLIYLLGSLWYYGIVTIYLNQTLSASVLLTACVLTTLPLDGAMAVFALLLSNRLRRHI